MLVLTSMIWSRVKVSSETGEVVLTVAVRLLSLDRKANSPKYEPSPSVVMCAPSLSRTSTYFFGNSFQKTYTC
jgi:hypothetical protein